MSVAKIEINKKSREYLIDRKSRIIFISSETSKQEPFLYEFINKHVESTADEIDEALQTLGDDQLLIINDLFPGILKMCKEEWKGDEASAFPVEVIFELEKRIRCSLCNTKNKEIYYIKNKINGEKMNVGSTCIQEFSTISLQEGKTKNALLKEATKIAYLKELIVKYPGIQNEVDTWGNLLEQFEILIPKDLENEYLTIGDELKQLFDSFLNGKEESLDNFSQVFDKKEKVKAKMNLYVKDNKRKRWVANSSIVNWLKRNKKFDIIELLKETGFVTSETASNIEEETYLTEISKEFNRHIEVFGFRITELRSFDDNKYIIYYKNEDITLECRTNSFIAHFGYKIFGPEDSNTLRPINIFTLSILSKESDYQKVIDKISTILIQNKSDYNIYQYDNFDYLERNELDILDTRIEKVSIIKLNEFVKWTKPFAFDSSFTNRLISEVNRYMENNRETKKYTINELKDIRDIR